MFVCSPRQAKRDRLKNAISKFAIALLLQYKLGRVSKMKRTGQHCRQDSLYESTVKVRDGMADHDLETLKVQKGRLGQIVFVPRSPLGGPTPPWYMSIIGD